VDLSLNAISGRQQLVSADNPRLGKAAHEFEASLMEEFLKPLEHDSLFDEKSEDDSGNGGEGSTGALMSYGSQALATAISERGGFGIATKIMDHFRTAHASTPTNVGAENKGFIKNS
jgi:peptidoglycan hydrolase FlgJ